MAWVPSAIRSSRADRGDVTSVHAAVMPAGTTVDHQLTGHRGVVTQQLDEHGIRTNNGTEGNPALARIA